MTGEIDKTEIVDPPPYHETTLQDDLADTANATDDGRVEIDLDSKLAQALNLVTRLPEYPTSPTQSPPPYREATWHTTMNIVIQVVGSRGDVQPFVALGNELQRHGHRVRIATHGVFGDFVRQSNLEFYSIGGDPVELMAYMVKNPGLIPEIKTLREGEIQKKRQMIREMLVGCWNSCIKPDPDSAEPFVADAIIANPPSFAHIHCAEAMGIPLHIMFTMPWTPTQSFPHPLARLRPSNVGQGMANYLSYGLVQALTWQGLADVINNFRKSIDLEAVPFTEGPFLSERLKIPHTYCWSPSLVPKPKDWPENIDVCGFFFRSTPEYTPPAALQNFLDKGKPPIYIGFGSIVLDDPDSITDTIVGAVQQSRCRAIVSAGWSKLGSNCKENLKDIIFLNDDCPHEWLFPRVAAVVHHGGAGTTACGLLNARPTLVIPFFGDQYFWGDMIAAAGAGPQPIRHRKLTSQNLAEAIQICLTPEAAVKAASIALGMKQENGVAAAVASFHRNLPSQDIKCDIDSTSAAIWVHKKSGKLLKLSGCVAETLMEKSKIKQKDLTPYASSKIYITNKRWDPTTAVVSSMSKTSFSILSAGNSIWKSPYDLHRAVASQNPSSDGSISAKHVAAMAGASAMSIPRIYGAMAKGFLLDLPLAVTEGLRNTPRLYGEPVRERDAITDWKSGADVAGKTFTENLKDAFTGLYTQPAEGMEKEGWLGLGKGIGKGLIGNQTKTGAAIIGLIAYPAEGISKSIHRTFHSKTRKSIVDARRLETAHNLEKQPVNDEVKTDWVRIFDELSQKSNQS